MLTVISMPNPGPQALRDFTPIFQRAAADHHEITGAVYQNSYNYASQIVSSQNQLKFDLISKRDSIYANQGELWLQSSRLLQRITVHRHEREAPLLIKT